MSEEAVRTVKTDSENRKRVKNWERRDSKNRKRVKNWERRDSKNRINPGRGRGTM